MEKTLNSLTTENTVNTVKMKKNVIWNNSGAYLNALKAMRMIMSNKANDRFMVLYLGYNKHASPQYGTDSWLDTIYGTSWENVLALIANVSDTMFGAEYHT